MISQPVQFFKFRTHPSTLLSMPILPLILALFAGACASRYKVQYGHDQQNLPAPVTSPYSPLPQAKPSQNAQSSVRAGAPNAKPRTRSSPPPSQPITTPRTACGAPHYYSSVAISESVVALTFDDGPHPVLTPRLLDVLKEHGVKATFFVIGKNAKSYPDIVARIVAEGHEIANHSWSHPNLSGMSDSAVLEQLKETNKVLKEATGVDARLFRPPYGAFSVRQRVMTYEKLGMPSILWSVDPLDWKIRSAPSVRSKLVSGAHPGAILLAHDIHASTVDAIPGVLMDLKARGFQFVTVSQLIAMTATADFAVAREDAR